MNRTKKAFTLIEIMIVVVIIGILAIALFPKLLDALGRASDDARKAELKNIVTAMIQYKSDNQKYPSSPSGECLSPTSSVGQELLKGKYLDKNRFPADPNSRNKIPACGEAGYFYYKSLSANDIQDNGFMVSAKMENKKKGNAGSLSLSSKEEFTAQDEGDYYIELY